MQGKTPYQILGISIDANEEEIKKAYRSLAKKYHPDSNAGNIEAQKKFQEISDAYQILQDKEKKKKLDEEISQERNKTNVQQKNIKPKTTPPTKAVKKQQVDLKNTNQQFADFFGFSPIRKK